MSEEVESWMEGTVNGSKYLLVDATVEFLREFVVDDWSFKESSSRELTGIGVE